MRILAIGDPHGDLASVKKLSFKGVDAIILTGNLGDASLARKMSFANIERRKKGLPIKEYGAKEYKRAYMQEYSSTLKVIRYLVKRAPVYTIFGNVELTPKETKAYASDLGLPLPDLTAALKALGVRIMNKKAVRINGVRVAGLPYFVDDCWVKEFVPENKPFYRAANAETKRMRSWLDSCGRVDVLVCHQPPYGVRDTVRAKYAPKHWKGKHAGSKIVLAYIKKYKPKYALCGHIHEGKGKQVVGKTVVYNLGTAGHTVLSL
jgi:Icc-related predicted phosphoesterase